MKFSNLLNCSIINDNISTGGREFTSPGIHELHHRHEIKSVLTESFSTSTGVSIITFPLLNEKWSKTGQLL